MIKFIHEYVKKFVVMAILLSFVYYFFLAMNCAQKIIKMLYITVTL